MKLQIKVTVFSLLFLMLQTAVYAQEQADAFPVTETQSETEIEQPESKSTTETTKVNTTKFDPLRYTLGPDDMVEITVQRHPEFSGVYPINQEGKIQYKFVGDVDAYGLTKFQLEQKIKDIISTYVNSPEVNVTVTEYRSKVVYVLGEVGAPGKYFMRSETMPIREAVVQAGLPTTSAAMRKCRLITPDIHGRPKVRSVDLYAVLYGGNLKKNINMYPGDVLYVPSTVMAKVLRVITPPAATLGIAAAGPDSAAAGRTAVETLQGRGAR